MFFLFRAENISLFFFFVQIKHGFCTENIVFFTDDIILIPMQIMISTGTEHANQIEFIVTDTESQEFLEQNIFFSAIIPKGVSA